MAALALTPLPLLLSLALGAEWEAGVRSEARVRAGAGADQPVASELDLELDPRLGLRLEVPRTASLALAYDPRLWLTEAGTPASVQVLHRGELSAEWRPARALRLTLAESAAYGTTDLSPVSQAATGPQVPLQSVPGALLAYLFTQTLVGAEATLHRHLRLTLGAGWLASGGADAASRLEVPLQRGPLADLALSWDLTRIDALATELAGSSSAFSTGRRSSLGFLEEIWTRALSSSATLRLGLGAGLDASTLPGQTARPAAQVVADAGLTLKPRVLEHTLSGSVLLRAAPIVDRLTGEAYERCDASLALGLPLTRALTLDARLQAGVVTTGSLRGNALEAGEVDLAFASSPVWVLALGVRADHQSLPTSLSEAAAFLSFGAAAHDRVPPWESSSWSR